MDKNKGIAMPTIIALVAALIVFGGIAYYNTRPEGEIMMGKGEDMMGEGEAMKKDGEVMVKEGETMKKEGETMMKKDEGAMIKDDAAMMKKDGDAMMEKDAGTMMAKYTGTVLAGKSAPLLEFNKTDYDAAIASDKLVVLYFYANWCPICKEEVANALIPAFNELTTDKVIGIRISYKDSETNSDEKALAASYGIPYQHTKVFVKNGKQILKAPDGWNKARYLDEINKELAQ